MSRLQIILLLLFFTFIGCEEVEQKAADNNIKIRAAATIAPYADFVKQIGGKFVSVYTVIPPRANAHTYEPSPQELIKISKADVFFKVGAGFQLENEFSFDELNVVDCSEDIKLLNNDPHVWLSPKNAKVILTTIYETLAGLQPEHQEYFNSNLVSYSVKIDSTFESIRKDLSQSSARNIFVYHNAWNYLARDLGIVVHEIEYGGKKPKLRDLDKHIQTAKRQNAKVIFADPNISTKSAEIIANELDAQVEYLNPLPQNYLANLSDTGAKLKLVLNND